MTSIQFAPKWSRIARLSLALATLAVPVCTIAQPAKYTIVDLGPVGPYWSQGQPFTVSGNGLVSGEAVVANPHIYGAWVSHAVLWEGTNMKDIGSPGLGGPNSVAYGVNNLGQSVGQADTETRDPNGEDFCGSTALGLTHSGNTCAPFLWQDGTMVELPRLRNKAGDEGNNGVANQNNFFGMIAGTAENAEVDSTCLGASVSQTIQFKPVIWTKAFPLSQVQIQELATVDGDPDGIAFAINDLGQAAGASGNCGPFNAIEQNNLIPLHAIYWRNGNAIDLGNLGGDGRGFAGIYASGLNDHGQVVGTSDTTGDASFHGFLWQQGHITDLGTVTGDSYSSAIAISNDGLVLGVSVSASFSPRAALWRDGTATDMNTLVPKDTALYLESACSINAQGEIIGFAYLKSNPNESHAYLAKPVANSGHED